MIHVTAEYPEAAAKKLRPRNALNPEAGEGGSESESLRYHLPVLGEETLVLLAPGPGKRYLDGTLGGGGHSEGLLKAGAQVIGFDQDPQAIAFATERLASFGERVQVVHANFAEAGEVLDRLGIARVDGALLDIGVSSWQLDMPERGFSFQTDGPLDMRMDPSGPVTAAEIVNTASAEELGRLLWTLGEEPASRRIAAEIVRRRVQHPLETTFDLVAAVEKVAPRRGRSHPATKVFQALRIAVNRELEVLSTALATISGRLNPGARFAVITFHSLEDRIVKNFFKLRATEWLDRIEWPEPRRNPEFQFRMLTPKPVVASEEEQSRNPRSRSAKLRAVEQV